MRIKQGSKLHRGATVLALVWMAGMAYFGVPEAARQVHDYYSLQPCAMALSQALEDRQVGIQHLPNDNEIDPIVTYAIGFEQAFSDRLSVMDCPSGVQYQLSELRYKHKLFLDYLKSIKADNNQYDGFFLGIRAGEVTRAISSLTSALAELLPKPETNPSPSSS